MVKTKKLISKIALSVAVLGSVAMSSSSAFAQTFPDMLYYKFNESGGTTTLNEASPFVGAQNATVNGAFALTPGAGQFNGGLVGSAGNGSTDFVDTGWQTDLTGDWTIHFWLDYTNGPTGLNYLFGDVTAASFRSFTNGAAGAGNVILRGGGMTDCTIVGGAAAANQPAAMTYVYDSSVPEVRGYLNGVLNVTTPQPVLNIQGTGATNFKVGSYSSSGGMAAGVAMDEFRLYGNALTALEVSQLWNTTLDDTPVNDDVALTAMFVPNGGVSSTVTADITVVNKGLNVADGNVDLDIDNDGFSDGSNSFTGLAAGDTVVVQIQGTVPGALGTYTASATATLTSGIDGKPFNNSTATTYDVVAGDDIEATSITAVSAFAGAQSTFDVVVTNNGFNPADGNVDIDVDNDGVADASGNFSGLVGGASTTVQISATSPATVGNFTATGTAILTSGVDQDNTNDVATTNYTTVPTSDVEVTSVTAPAGLLNPGDAVQIDIVVTNNGQNAADIDVSVDYENDGVDDDVQTITALASLASQTVSFNTTAPGQGGQITVLGTVLLTSDIDQDATNDTGTDFYDVLPGCVTTYPFLETFDTFANGTNLPVASGWTNASGTTASYNWTIDDLTTSSGSTGPNDDVTAQLGGGTGKYIYVETSSGVNGEITTLDSRCFDLTTLASPTLKFYYHMYGLLIGDLHVDIMDTSGNVIGTSLWNQNGQVQLDELDPWESVKIGLGAYAGQVIKVRFRYIKNGGCCTGDAAIDHVSITEGSDDISVTDVSLNGAASVGSQVDFDVTVYNFGLNAADGNVDIDVEDDGIVDGSANFTGLASGTSTVVTVSGIAPLTIGNYTASASATLTSAVDGDTSDNTGSTVYTVTPSEDVGVVAFAATPNPVAAGSSFDLNVDVQNLGASPADVLVEIDYENDGIVDASSNISGLASGGTQTETFNTAAPGTAGNYTASVAITLTSGIDGDASNNNATAGYSVTPGCVITFPATETFDSWATGNGAFDVSTGWTQSTTDGMNWTVFSGSTTSGSSGPTKDFTNEITNGATVGNYLYTETSGFNNLEATIISTCYDLSFLTAPELTFYYHMVGATMGDLHVDILDQTTGTTTTDVFVLTGQQQANEADPWEKATVSLTPFLGNQIRLQFRGMTGSSFTSDMGIDQVKIGEAATDDVGITNLVVPTALLNPGDAVQIDVEVTNFGVNPADYDVNVDWDDDGVIDATLSGTGLVNGAMDTLIFNTTAPAQGGVITVNASVALTNGIDLEPLNDNSTGTYNVLPGCVTTYPFLETFDAFANGNVLPVASGWVNTSGPLAAYNWTIDDLTTGSANTGPSNDVTAQLGGGTGKYIFVETSSGVNGQITTLDSRCFDLTSLASPTLKFYYHFYGNLIGDMHVDILDENDVVLATSLWNLSGQVQLDELDPWESVKVGLGAYAGQNIKVRWRYIKNGGCCDGDAAIDHVSITEGTDDVAVTSVALNGAAPVGATTTFDVSVYNFGLNPADGTVDLDLDNDGVIDGSGAFTAIAAGGTQVVSVSGIAPLTIGNYTASATANLLSATDGDLSDNTNSTVYTVTPNEDMAISNIVVGNAYSGMTATFSADVTNLGASAADGTVDFDVDNDGIADGSGNFTGLASGLTETVTVSIAAGVGNPFDVFTVSATVTLTSGVDGDPSNDTATSTYTLIPTDDVSAQNLTGPTAPTDGSTNNYDFELVNNGINPASGTFDFDVDTDGTPEIVAQAYGPIAPGDTLAIMVTATIPSAVAGSFTATVTQTLVGDGDPSNDSATLGYTVPLAGCGANALTTTFASGNGAGGNMFDIVAINDVVITCFDVHFDPGVGDFEVWIITGGGTYVGSETNAANWTLIGSFTGLPSSSTALDDGTPTQLPILINVPIATGATQGFYVTRTSGSVNYTNGTAVGNVFAQDANIQFLEGVGKGYPFGATNTPRIFNGNIIYDLGAPSIDAPVTMIDGSTLSWPAVTNANNYWVYQAANPNGPFNTSTSVGNVLTWTDPAGATSAEPFYYVTADTDAPVVAPTSNKGNNSLANNSNYQIVITDEMLAEYKELEAQGLLDADVKTWLLSMYPNLFEVEHSK
ncbi:MAG: hypothetical protein DWQ06_15540 [Calditrichaeota bacterium]|nr:MAG: hypothetical protein DWQ06_15540 [Calditrichota bacterium]